MTDDFWPVGVIGCVASGGAFGPPQKNGYGVCYRCTIIRCASRCSSAASSPPCPQPLPRNVQCARDAVGRVQGASLRALVALPPHAKRDARFVYLIIPQETDIDRFHDALEWAIASLYQPPSYLRGETWNHSSMMYDSCSPVSGTSSRRATPRNASQSFEAVAVGRCCCCCSPLLLLYISHYFQTLHNQLTLDTR